MTACRASAAFSGLDRTDIFRDHGQRGKRGFAVEGEFVECKPWGNGHVNDTYIMTFRQGGVESRYSLQHMTGLSLRIRCPSWAIFSM